MPRSGHSAQAENSFARRAGCEEEASSCGVHGCDDGSLSARGRLPESETQARKDDRQSKYRYRVRCPEAEVSVPVSAPRATSPARAMYRSYIPAPRVEARREQMSSPPHVFVAIEVHRMPALALFE